MFTGITTDIGTIETIEKQGDALVSIVCNYPADSIAVGASIACDGACLTVTDKGTYEQEAPSVGGASPACPPKLFRAKEEARPMARSADRAGGNKKTIISFSISAETLARTTLSDWKVGGRVNLERALKLGDELGGHMVTGHIDGRATLLSAESSGDSTVWQLEAPAELARFIAEKGSVTLNGVSLTVNRMENTHFWVNLIPHTQQITNLGQKTTGDTLNLEIDLIARYLARLKETQETR